MLRRYSLALLVAVMALFCYSTAAMCETIEVEYEFERPLLKAVELDGQLFNRVIVPDTPNSGAIGHPALPSRGARILVPYGHEVISVEAISLEAEGVHTDLRIEPVQRPIPMSLESYRNSPLFIDDDLYSMKSTLNPDRYENTGVQVFRGYRLLVLKLNPVEYVPATGELTCQTRMLIKVTTAETAESVPLLRDNPADRAEVSTWVDNHQELVSYDMATRDGSRSYDMLIITHVSLVAPFQPLKDYHDTTGVLTEIHTTADIGSNDPHDVRDYIRQEYQESGIQYVLIGADDEYIPALNTYCVTWEGPDAITEYQMPCDFYFSCLDGTFNYDGDGRWGEPGDGEGGGEVDLFPDVHVARVSAESVTEVENLVNKTIAYMSGSSRALENVVLAGEQLNFGGLGEYGGYAMEEMVDGSSAHGFTTYGFPSDVYSIEKIFDYLIEPNNYWPPSEIIQRINSGVHIIDHLGHSGPQYAMRTDTDMLIQQLTNTEYCFLYAEGCSAGKFDLTDCWGEYVTVKLAHGGFACLANCRLGIGATTTQHPVHVFNREFWDAIYNGDEAKPQIGRAISDSRADHAYHINDPAIRWTFYEITLFGDPSVAIKPVTTLAITFPDGLPDQIPPKTEVPFEVCVQGVGNGVPVPGSGWLHYATGRESDSIPMTELTDSLYEAVLPPMECGETIDFYFSVEEQTIGMIYEPDPSSPFSVSPVSEEEMLFQDDFETDKGWTISGGLWERGVPQGLGGDDNQYPVPDPTEGCNGPQVLGYNLAGDYENDLPAMHVTSPAIDCSGKDNIVLRYCRSLGVERPMYDEATIYASNDNENWTLVWKNYATIVDRVWQEIEFDISSIADNQPTLYLRWVMGPTDGGLRYHGWNIDDVRVVSLQCRTWVCGDADTSGEVDIDDVVYLINYIFAGGPAPDPIESGDADCSSGVDIDDVVYLIAYIFSGGNAPCDIDGDQVPDC